MHRYADRLEPSAKERAIVRKCYQETRDRRIAERLLSLLMKTEGLIHEMVGRVLGVARAR